MDPDLADATVACAYELRDALDDFAATSDKIDEVHEQIQDMFDDFPDYSDVEALIFSEGDFDVNVYFAWLDAELAKRETEKVGGGFVIFETRSDDNISVFVVERGDIDRIIQLGDELGLRIQRGPVRNSVCGARIRS